MIFDSTKVSVLSVPCTVPFSKLMAARNPQPEGCYLLHCLERAHIRHPRTWPHLVLHVQHHPQSDCGKYDEGLAQGGSAVLQVCLHYLLPARLKVAANMKL